MSIITHGSSSPKAIANALEVSGGSAAIFPAVIVLISAYLIWFANDAKQKGWIS